MFAAGERSQELRLRCQRRQFAGFLISILTRVLWNEGCALTKVPNSSKGLGGCIGGRFQPALGTFRNYLKLWGFPMSQNATERLGGRPPWSGRFEEEFQLAHS